MLKGYKRRVIVVKDTGSRMFDSAYFVLNEGVGEEGINDMVKEATRIIGEKSAHLGSAFFARGLFAFSLGLASASLFLALSALLLG